MKTPTNTDVFDGHLLETEWDVAPGLVVDPEVDELVHNILHPPWCRPSRMDLNGDAVEWSCPAAWHQDMMSTDAWPDATTPGVRTIGWRHDVTASTPSGPAEHDLVAFTIGDPIIQMEGND